MPTLDWLNRSSSSAFTPTAQVVPHAPVMSVQAELVVSEPETDADPGRTAITDKLMIRGDTRPANGNVLTQAVLDALLALHTEIHGSAPAPAPQLLVYGEACRLGRSA